VCLKKNWTATINMT